MKSYMSGICKHISVNIKSILTDICKLPKFRSIYAQNKISEIFIYRSKNAKFRHLSVEISFLEKYHISVNIKLTLKNHILTDIWLHIPVTCKVL